MTFEPIQSVTGMDDEETRTLNQLLQQLDDKRPRNLMRASVYDGKRALRQVGSVIPPQYYRMGLVLGWVPKGVDALARRCNLERFTWADGDLDSLGARQVQDENYLTTEINSAIVSTLIHGVSYLVTVKGEDDEPEALVLARDALNATGEWNVRKRALDNLVSVTAREEDRPTEITLYLDGTTINIEKAKGGWRVVADGRSQHSWGVPAEPMVYHPRLGRPFGSSRITRPAMAHQDAGLRTLIRLEGHMDVYSLPELILLGADGNVFKDEQGNTLPDWRVSLGRIKGIPDDESAPDNLARADIKQINAASPEPQLANLNTQAKLCAREMSLPDNALALTDVSNPTSAESYDASQYELIHEAEEATEGNWSTPLNKTFARALAIYNGETSIPDEYASINAKWRKAQYLTRAAEADAGAKQLGAVPWLAETEVGLELLGLTDDQMRRAMADKRRAESTQRLGMLALAANDGQPATDDSGNAEEMKRKFDALGVAIRAGVDPAVAASQLGLQGLKFTGATPVSLRQPLDEARSLEDR